MWLGPTKVETKVRFFVYYILHNNPYQKVPTTDEVLRQMDQRFGQEISSLSLVSQHSELMNRVTTVLRWRLFALVDSIA